MPIFVRVVKKAEKTVSIRRVKVSLLLKKHTLFCPVAVEWVDFEESLSALRKIFQTMTVDIGRLFFVLAHK